MPHSSGGGSHGGGFHGGSHGGSGTRMSRSYFAGATRYIYYWHGVPNEIFSNTDLKKNAASTRGAMTFFAVMFMGMITLVFMLEAFHYPNKLETDYDTAIYISDHANVMTVEEEGRLMESLIRFQDETGITPYVCTVYDYDWSDKSNLEDYAYDLYVERFKDEKHWLIVYSVPDESSSEDWSWEGMQGDDTDPILGDRETKMFGRELTDLLENNRDLSPAGAIARTFDDTTPEMMRQYTIWGFVIAGCVAAAAGAAAVVLIQIFGRKSARKYETAITVERNEVLKQQNCDYCGGIYVEGHHTTCPHCGAQLPFIAPVFEQDGDSKR